MPDISIHIGDMLSRNARMYPDDIALVERTPAENKRWEITWKAFDEGANRFANVLMEKGIQKGDKVVHLMMNSIDWLIAYFGIIRTGAWVVPLNFRFTGGDIKYCIDVTEPKLVLFGEEFTERIREIREQVPVEDRLNADCGTGLLRSDRLTHVQAAGTRSRRCDEEQHRIRQGEGNAADDDPPGWFHQFACQFAQSHSTCLILPVAAAIPLKLLRLSA